MQTPISMKRATGATAGAIGMPLLRAPLTNHPTPPAGRDSAAGIAVAIGARRMLLLSWPAPPAPSLDSLSGDANGVTRRASETPPATCCTFRIPTGAPRSAQPAGARPAPPHRRLVPSAPVRSSNESPFQSHQAQAPPAPRKPGFHRSLGRAHCPGNLLDGKILQVEQGYGAAFLLRQPLQ